MKKLPQWNELSIQEQDNYRMQLEDWRPGEVIAGEWDKIIAQHSLGATK